MKKPELWNTMTFPGATLKDKRIAQLRACGAIGGLSLFRNTQKMIAALIESKKSIKKLSDMDSIEAAA